jgi:hypothetical protein
LGEGKRTKKQKVHQKQKKESHHGNKSDGEAFSVSQNFNPHQAGILAEVLNLLMIFGGDFGIYDLGELIDAGLMGGRV